MQKNSQDFSMQEALRVAQSPAGQQLLALLRQADPAILEQAAIQASGNSPEQLKKTLETLTEDPRIAQLLKQLGR